VLWTESLFSHFASPLLGGFALTLKQYRQHEKLKANSTHIFSFSARLRLAFRFSPGKIPKSTEQTSGTDNRFHLDIGAKKNFSASTNNQFLLSKSLYYFQTILIFTFHLYAGWLQHVLHEELGMNAGTYLQPHQHVYRSRKYSYYSVPRNSLKLLTSRREALSVPQKLDSVSSLDLMSLIFCNRSWDHACVSVR
jgi:hypothetical protein